MAQSKLIPKLVTVFQEGYSRSQFGADLLAGVIVGIVALPLAIAFAIASGVKPEQGLYTAIIAGFVVSVLSGSRVQIGGPTGAFIVIIYSIVQKHGYDGLATATMMAGALLILMGVARLGAVIKYIPYPVTVGFTAGIALIIFAGQLRDLLGLQMDQVPAEFLEKWPAYAANLDSLNPWALGLGGVTVAIILLWPRVTGKIPGSLLAILLTTLIVHLFALPVETIGSRFGSIPTSLPMPRLPHISLELMRELFAPALAIALLAGIESLLSAVVADGMTERRHRSNMELIAQGAANMMSPLFGGIPATGAIARTAINIKNGGRTPVAGIVHALTLLLMMVFFGKWAALIPMATLAGILIVVAWHMSEWRLFVRLFRSPRSDILVLISTFALTVFVDLIIAIQVGVVLAALLFMQRMAATTQISNVGISLSEQEEDANDPLALHLRRVPAGVEVYEIAGPFFFGAADKFENAMASVSSHPKVLILRLRHVPAIDATALRALETLHQRSLRMNTTLILSGVNSDPMLTMRRAGFIDKVGNDNVFDHIDEALKRAGDIVERGG